MKAGSPTSHAAVSNDYNFNTDQRNQQWNQTTVFLHSRNIYEAEQTEAVVHHTGTQDLQRSKSTAVPQAPQNLQPTDQSATRQRAHSTTNPNRSQLRITYSVVLLTFLKQLRSVIENNHELSWVLKHITDSTLAQLKQEVCFMYDQVPSALQATTITNDLSRLGYAYSFGNVICSLFVALLREEDYYLHVKALINYLDAGINSKYRILTFLDDQDLLRKDEKSN